MRIASLRGCREADGSPGKSPEETGRRRARPGGTSNVAETGARGGYSRGGWPRGVLVHHHSGDGSGERARAYTPKPENGRTMFYAGGCASCHMSPDQDDKTRLGGGRPLKSPFGHLLRAEYLQRSEGRHRQLERAQFRHRDVEGYVAGREALLSRLPVHSYQRMRLEDVRDLFAFMKTLPAVSRPGARPRPAGPIQHPAHARRLEIPVPGRREIHPGPEPAGDLEPRRLSGQRPGALRRVPQPAQLARGNLSRSTVRGRPGPRRRRRLGAQYHPGMGSEELSEKEIAYRAHHRRPARAAIPSAAAWGVVGNILAVARRRTAPRWRPTSSRCRRSKAPSTEPSVLRRIPASSGDTAVSSRPPVFPSFRRPA